MAFRFEAEGWEDFAGNRHEGTPSLVEDTHGVFVHVTDEGNPDNDDYFWAFAKGFEDWAEWWVYIGSLMEMYGMDLAE